MIATNKAKPGVRRATAATPTVEAPRVTPRTLVPGSPLARVLFHVMTGQRVTIVNSPPGAGKTTLIGELVRHLVATTDLSIKVLSPTNAGGALVATRISGQLLLDDPKHRVTVSKKMDELTRFPNATAGTARVSVTTVASAMMTNTSTQTTDLLIVDEAYQVQLSDILQALSSVVQVLLVGDPGQIGPVVTSNVSAWEHLGNVGPSSPAPHFFAARDDAATVTLPATYRLGATTVKAIAPLYPFPFASARPDRILAARDGAPMPEIARICVADPETPHDMQTMRKVAQRALDLEGQTVVGADGKEHTLDGRDIAVVVSHNAQVAAVRSLFASAHAERFTVGTADSLQGSEWLCVVALDPLIGHADATPHSQSTGRLCVMLSRHSAHLTWVHGTDWRDALTESPTPDDKERRLGARVREALIHAPELTR